MKVGMNKVLKGYGLVDVKPDVYERKRNFVYLSKDGEKFIKELTKILGGA